MNPCIVFQALQIMFASHMGVPADQAKLQEVIAYQQKECQAWETKQKKEEKSK